MEFHINIVALPWKSWKPPMPMGPPQEEFSRPAYVVEARHGALTAITLASMVRGLAERGAVWGPLKRQRQREIHPPETWQKPGERYG